jgi:hypothetical protein
MLVVDLSTSSYGLADRISGGDLTARTTTTTITTPATVNDTIIIEEHGHSLVL